MSVNSMGEGGPKYSLPEIERRWWVDLALAPPLSELAFQEIRDYRLAGDLRLRRVTGPDGSEVYKLGKKYGPPGLVRPITNLYLSRTEFEALVPASEPLLHKRRYNLPTRPEGSLDVPVAPQLPPRWEVEFSSVAEATRYRPPEFTTAEERDPGSRETRG